MSRIPLLLTVLCAACSGSDEPAWAFDPISLTPDGDGVYAVHTWQLYSARWEQKNHDKHYVCAVIVELVGEPVACDAEPGCTHAWAVAPRLLETDCAGPVLDNPLFESATALALGGPAGGDAPYPGQTLAGYADYGRGWEAHGHAYPESLDTAPAPALGEWDGAEAFLMMPTLAFPFP